MKYYLWKFAAVLLFVVSSQNIQAQLTCDDGRYAQEIFPEITVTEEILFGESLQPTFSDSNNTQELFLDFYEPTGDSLAERPLIILAFGGSFVAGSRVSPDIVDLCERYAKMGYATASIDYRLTLDLIFNPSQKTAFRAVLKATHDMRAAVRYFYKDAQTNNQFKIDTSQIFVGGVSAGGIAAVHLAYLDSAEVPALIAGDMPDLGGIEGLSGNPGYSSDVVGVINLAGGIQDTAWIDAGDVPIVSAHGTADDVIPYGAGTILLFNLNLPFYGSASIQTRMDSLGIRNDLVTFIGGVHAPFSVPPNDSAYRDTTFQFVRDFLVDEVCESATSSAAKPIAQTLRMYPNPMRESAVINLPQPQLYDLVISDLTGKEMNMRTEYEVDGIRIWKNSLTAGLYLVRLKHKQNRSLHVGKLVVE